MYKFQLYSISYSTNNKISITSHYQMQEQLLVYPVQREHFLLLVLVPVHCVKPVNTVTLWVYPYAKLVREGCIFLVQGVNHLPIAEIVPILEVVIDPIAVTFPSLVQRIVYPPVHRGPT